MISKQLFTSLESIKKQEYLLGIFAELWNDNKDINNIIELLESWFIFQWVTLDQIYDSIVLLLKENKDKHITQQNINMHNIQLALEKESSNSSDKADALLENI